MYHLYYVFRQTYFVIIVIICILTIIPVVYTRLFFMIVLVQGSSMEPTFSDGDRVLVLRKFYKKWLKKGRIVIGYIPSSNNLQTSLYSLEAQNKKRFFVKRLLGMPGDRVNIPTSRIPNKLQDIALLHKEVKQEQDFLSWHIPQKYCFVKGDSYPSLDSVFFGPIPLSNLVGIVLFKLSSSNNAQNLDLSTSFKSNNSYKTFR